MGRGDTAGRAVRVGGLEAKLSAVPKTPDNSIYRRRSQKANPPDPAKKKPRAHSGRATDVEVAIHILDRM
jgi:hypothetical protein